MKILIAVDGSECSDYAVAEIAKRPWPEGSEVRILSAAEPIVRAASALNSLPAQYFDEIDSAAGERARIVAEQSMASFSEKNAQKLPVTTAVVAGIPKEAIIEESEKWNPDLIVVGSHGYRGYKRLLLGSVSQAVASLAKCSVEIVRSKRSQQ